ncbi:hypothetical protein EDD18DRAFT_1115249 [Armillaria luteobubalina]|uniref:Uncharacterized protein n=1 Tax=Armillaria luteobubalina TaxID=153913 RepID=A0AA39P2X5_9AGAR|nr:hypothetical protein EDD18DRAFT_1115249 [Armillaria luteobubalina]
MPHDAPLELPPLSLFLSQHDAPKNHYSECRSASPPITNEEVVVEPPFRPHAKWYLLRARDVETKFHARMRGWTPCEYMERLYQCFLQLYLKGVCGAMFEIDDEEETLQTLLDELHQCTEGILNVVGVGKTYRLVEDIIQDVALVHSWLFEIQTDVFAEGQEYIVYQHRKSALLYQQENFEN